MPVHFSWVGTGQDERPSQATVRRSDMPFIDESHSLWEVKGLRRALHAAGVALWAWTVETDAFAMDERAFDLWGLPETSEVTFEDLSSHIHPADRTACGLPLPRHEPWSALTKSTSAFSWARRFVGSQPGISAMTRACTTVDDGRLSGCHWP